MPHTPHAVAVDEVGNTYPRGPVVLRVCAWCQSFMGVKDAGGNRETMLSHGMCEACQEKWVAELEFGGGRDDCASQRMVVEGVEQRKLPAPYNEFPRHGEDDQSGNRVATANPQQPD